MSTGDERGPVAGGQAPLQGCHEEAVVAQLNMLAERFFRDRLAGSWVPGYLQARGFSPAMQDHWQAGYAPAGWDALTRYLRSLGFAEEVIEQAGLARRSRPGNLFDVFRDRALFPVRSPSGTIAGFIGRASDYAPADVPKYLNSPRTCLYNKSALLFGLWEARESLAAGARAVIVEGPLDAIAVTAAGQGRFAGVAPCGIALTAKQPSILGKVTDLHTVGALVAFDDDSAGRRAATRAYHLLCPLTEKVDAVEFPPGQDPAQVLRCGGQAALYEALASRTRPLADVVIDSELQRWEKWLQYAEGQVNALLAAAQLITSMPAGHVGRQVDRLANRLNMSHAFVTEAVTDALTERNRPAGMSSRGHHGTAPSRYRCGPPAPGS